MAKNIYGYGEISDPVTINPSDVPSKVAIPSVTITGTSVLIDWVAPNTNFAIIDLYEILFLKQDTSYGKDNTNCNGNNAGIVTATQCTVPMTTIITLTSLPVDTLIRVKVRAHNVKGWSDFSELNIQTARIETVPSQMALPTFNLALTTNT